jgi:hypothetical protein
VPGGPRPLVSPGDYLRILSNPFLGLLGLLGWFVVVRWLIAALRRSPELTVPLSPILVVLVVAALFGLTPALFQYHCLDCGATGRLSRWRTHLCPASNLRRQSGRHRWLRGPSPFVQNIIWFWLVLTALIVLRYAS